jgi:hypothetical protein
MDAMDCRDVRCLTNLATMQTISNLHKSLAASSFEATRCTMCTGRILSVGRARRGAGCGSVCTYLGCTMTAILKKLSEL